MQTGDRSPVSRSSKFRPVDDRQVERRKVARTHDLVVGARPPALVGRRLADHLEEQPAEHRLPERQRARPSDAAHARHGHDLPLDVVEELQQRWPRRELRCRAGRRPWSARPARGIRDRRSPPRAACAAAALRRRAGARRWQPVPTTSSDRRRPPRPVEVRDSDATASASDSRVACHDGARPNRTPTSSAVTAQKTTTRRSNVSVTAAGSSCSGISTGATCRMAAPMASPSAPPRTPRKMLSVSSWRIRRPRDGAERRPDRQFAFAAGGAGEQQVRDVCAADQQDDADDADEQQGRGAQLAADERLVQRLDRDAAAFVGGGELAGRDRRPPPRGRRGPLRS